MTARTLLGYVAVAAVGWHVVLQPAIAWVWSSAVAGAPVPSGSFNFEWLLTVVRALVGA